jgi:hypothetical protein
MFELKIDTSATILFGPVMDTDGAPVVGLTKGGVDEVGVYKDGATALTDLSAVDITHRGGGMYTTALAAGTVDTFGKMRFFIRDDSECIPVWEDFMVLTANAYDSKYSTDKLQVDLTQIDGQATNGNNATLKLKQLDIQNSAGSALVANSTGGNGHGVEAAGHGTGKGVSALGGATGHGIGAIGGGGVGTGDGINAAGGDTAGHGLTARALTAGEGINAIGGSSSGVGIKAAASGGNEAGFECVKNGTGKDIDADEIDAILVDTGTTLPGSLSTIEGKIDTVDGIVDAILADTGTTLPASLSTIEGKIDTVDGIADAILVDTGTTIPALISGIGALGACQIGIKISGDDAIVIAWWSDAGIRKVAAVSCAVAIKGVDGTAVDTISAGSFTKNSDGVFRTTVTDTNMAAGNIYYADITIDGVTNSRPVKVM